MSFELLLSFVHFTRLSTYFFLVFCIFVIRYTLTSDINQRTKYCLLSVHLFKVRGSSMCSLCFISTSTKDTLNSKSGFLCPCLLSRYMCLLLLQCVLRCSMAQPLADLQFAHHSIGEELLPGTDLFSEPHRVHLGTTVSSLKFLCQWLFTTGFYTTVLTDTHTL